MTPRQAAWRAGQQALRLVPLRVSGRIFARPALGLCYHVVSDRALPHVAPLYPYKSPAHFAADLRWLKRRHHLLTYDELEDAWRSGRGPGRNAVFLSFDDGYAECFSVARPLLLEHGVPATLFLATDALDNRRLLAFNQAALCLDALRGMGAAAARDALRQVEDAAGVELPSRAAFAAWVRPATRDPRSAARATLDRLCAVLGIDVEGFLARERPYLTTEQARQLAADGFTLGGHTRAHPHLGRLGCARTLEEEIVESCRVAGELGGRERVPFAFPYDGVGVDRGALAGILDRHPEIGLVFGTDQIRRDDAGFIVNRMIVDTPGRGAGSSLPAHLRSAYLDALLRPPPAGGAAAGAR
ncbi:MAG TPA: polysaccharide deacetylase family protein [Longimicrobium sp.]|nr:polysaccharide deacetylase family protein [Longimicrobium sp.]